MTKAMPTQGIDLKSGVYRTPENFMNAVKKEFRIIGDLAANEENKQAYHFVHQSQDALSEDWADLQRFFEGDEGEGFLWLNPPYDNIGKWAEKCAVESVAGAKILLLVPAAVGSNWYRKYVEGFAAVRFLTGRLVFDFDYPEDYIDKKTGKLSPKAGKPNTDPYPKDLLLAISDRGLAQDERYAETWNWKAYL